MFFSNLTHFQGDHGPPEYDETLLLPAGTLSACKESHHPLTPRKGCHQPLFPSHSSSSHSFLFPEYILQTESKVIYISAGSPRPSRHYWLSSFYLNKRFSPKAAWRKGLFSCFVLWFARRILLLEACRAHAEVALIGNTDRRYLLMI